MQERSIWWLETGCVETLAPAVEAFGTSTAGSRLLPQLQPPLDQAGSLVDCKDQDQRRSSASVGTYGWTGIVPRSHIGRYLSSFDTTRSYNVDVSKRLNPFELSGDENYTGFNRNSDSECAKRQLSPYPHFPFWKARQSSVLKQLSARRCLQKSARSTSLNRWSLVWRDFKEVPHRVPYILLDFHHCHWSHSDQIVKYRSLDRE